MRRRNFLKKAGIALGTVPTGLTGLANACDKSEFNKENGEETDNEGEETDNEGEYVKFVGNKSIESSSVQNIGPVVTNIDVSGDTVELSLDILNMTSYDVLFAFSTLSLKDISGNEIASGVAYTGSPSTIADARPLASNQKLQLSASLKMENGVDTQHKVRDFSRVAYKTIVKAQLDSGPHSRTR